MRISQLEALAASGARIALWGWGREGRAAYGALRHRDSGIANRESGKVDGGRSGAKAAMPLTLFCRVEEAVEAGALGDPALSIETEATAERLARFDVVVKSPGISPYRPEAVVAAARGTRFIGGTALWFASRPDARTLCVTGTKGKSTTTALLAHLLRAAGVRTALAGNIGLPLLELLDGEADAWVIELSSYQTRDVADSGVNPEIAVVTNVFPEHLDWHGSEQRYIDDKLALLTEARPRIAVLKADDATLSSLVGAPHGRDGFVDRSIGPMGRSYTGQVHWFGRDDGWHLRGDALYRGDQHIMDTRALPLPGRHNRGNLCAVLAAIEAYGLDAAALAPQAASFQPLPHRLQTLGKRDGVDWINDSISTTPHATLAALEVFRGRKVAVLVGGHDRGLDWSAFAATIRLGAPHAVVTLGDNGPRIHDLLVPLAREVGFRLLRAGDLGEAVARGRESLAGEGVLLLSPGAPSFGAYRDYTERGHHFAALGGFDPAAITAIQGLGIA
ncbi:MAG: UDP-N-acetylmuramoyl-L-alanine--D-glutamate ligase [Luteimonas sp.]